MPTAESVAEKIRAEGEWVTFTRGSLSVTVKAFVRGYAPQQLVGDIDQGDRELRIAPADLIAAGWTGGPPREPDRVRIGSARAVVQDTETRTLREVPCMHIIHVRGA